MINELMGRDAMFLRAYGCAWLFFVCVSGAIAQTQLPADRELSRERQERLLQEQQRRLDDLQSLPIIGT